MGTIRAHEFTGLDGVIDAPTWTFDFGLDSAKGQDIGNLMASCRAILLGRNTYEMFQPAWSARTVADDPGAPFMNESTKYVVSSTLTEGAWQNSKIVGRYTAEGIRQVKDEVDRGVYVSGSSTLVRAFTGDELLDELHLFVYPVTRGTGPRLFPDDLPTNWSLLHSSTYDKGALYLAYQASAS
jgi:dihydrofolate reductase